MTPEEFAAELEDWARNDYLKSRVPKDIPEPARTEIAQESFRRIRARDPATIKDPAKIRAYGAKVVKNVTIEFICRAHRRQQRFDEDKVAESPEEALNQQQLEALLHRALESLPQALRQSIELFHLEELSAAEVARRLGVTVQTVYSYTRDGMKRLKSKLKELGIRSRRDNP